jgi:hypothetical protein
MKRIFVLILFGWLIANSALWGDDSSSQSRIVPPVDTDKSIDRTTFQAGFDEVWRMLLDLLTEFGFKFQIRDKSQGRLETDYVTFSLSPHFSEISNGVKTFAKPPRAFLKKWDDGKMKIVARVTRGSDGLIQMVLRPEIYGLSSTFKDDSSVTGEWRQCQSNGKFEFEVFNEIATRLQKKSRPVNPGGAPAKPPEEASEAPSTGVTGETSNVLVSSLPEGAEILVNNELVGMTPSRLVLKAGKYQVILRKNGYKKFIRQIVVKQGSDLTFSAELKEN